MTNEEQLITLDRQSKELKTQIELGDALERLSKNKDFKAVVTEGFLKSEAIRLVLLKADENMQDPVKQANIIKQIDAIGSFVSYLNTITQFSNIARKQNIDIEEQRQYIEQGGE